jgi:hypothetical protein
MQFYWIGLQIETKNTGAVVLRRGFSTKICKPRRQKYAFVILETHPNKDFYHQEEHYASGRSLYQSLRQGHRQY